MRDDRDDDLRHWDSDRIRENHDDDHNYDADEALDRWLLGMVIAIAFFTLFGFWKFLELAVALIALIV